MFSKRLGISITWNLSNRNTKGFFCFVLDSHSKHGSIVFFSICNCFLMSLFSGTFPYAGVYWTDGRSTGTRLLKAKVKGTVRELGYG